MEKNLLKGKTAVVTGGASGIGRCVSELFLSEGAAVVAVDANEEKVKKMCQELACIKGECIDICSEESVKKLFDDIPRADILVNCAGIFREGDILDCDTALWNKILNVNLNGTFLMSKYAAQKMAAGDGGSIVNIASEAGIAAIAGQVAYNTSKAAVIMLTKSMAVDLALKNIRVNCVCPGRVRTPLVDAIIAASDDPEKTLHDLSSDRPVMRIGDPHEIANACLMFASDMMTYATGAALSVDGAYTAR